MEELYTQAKLRIESLERQLVFREEKVATEMRSRKELQDRVQMYHEDLEREKEDIFEISADMTRQYKGMQEELLARVNLLENTIQEQKDQLEKSRQQLEEMRREKAQEQRRAARRATRC